MTEAMLEFRKLCLRVVEELYWSKPLTAAEITERLFPGQCFPGTTSPANPHTQVTAALRALWMAGSAAVWSDVPAVAVRGRLTSPGVRWVKCATVSDERAVRGPENATSIMEGR